MRRFGFLRFLSNLNWKRIILSIIKYPLLIVTISYVTVYIFYTYGYGVSLQRIQQIDYNHENVEIFDLNMIKEGMVIFVMGIPEYRNESLIQVDSILRYDYYHIAIRAYEDNRVYRYKIPYYATPPFNLGYPYLHPEEKQDKQNSIQKRNFQRSSFVYTE